MSISNDEFQMVELYIAGRNLKDADTFSKSDPLVKVFLQENGVWNMIGKTEQIKDNLNPNFIKTIPANLIFEIKQPIKFAVYDEDGTNSEDNIGEATTELGKIAGAKSQTVILDLTIKGKNAGKLIVRLDSPGVQSNQVISWQWAGSKIKSVDGWFDKSDPFLKFYKTHENGDQFLCYQTTQVMDNANPVWANFEINMSKLCYGNLNGKIIIECWDWEKSGNHQFIGKATITVNQLVELKKEFALLDNKGKNAGNLVVKSFQILERPTFMDFIRGGETLSFILAVDFTASNGDPKSSDSLHYVKPNGGLNQYQSAILGISEIVLNYDNDRMIPAFGFGGKPHYQTLNSSKVMHCFPLTGNPQSAEVKDIQGVMQAYFTGLQFVELAGPTYFEGVIGGAMQVAQANIQKNCYSVLLIITDGEIHDMDETVDLLVKAAYLPLSVIIVGVGNEEFTDMKKLDCDNGSLKNSQGQQAARDLVQFVAMRDYHDKAHLAKDVLGELPKQLCDYKRIMNMQPNPPLQVNFSNMTI